MVAGFLIFIRSLLPVRFYSCFIFVSLCLSLTSSNVFAQKDTEKELVHEIVTCLQTGDDSTYAALFPTYKFLAEQIYTFSPKDSFQTVRIQRLRSNMRHLREFDPELNPKLLDMMEFVRSKGADSGIHWGDIMIVKYELDKQRLPYELTGYEMIAQIRMQGFIFIRDMLTRKRYGIPVRDIYFINGKWYGGTVLNILEASSPAEYEESLTEEQKHMQYLMMLKQQGLLDSFFAAKDSIKKSKMYTTNLDLDEEDEDEEQPSTIFKEIIDRKLFTGYFDKIMEVELYIRYIKGTCPEQICSWEAMYRFDDLDEFIQLEVEQKPDGTFVFTEDELGVMELRQQGNTFTGTWTSVADKTEYEVYIKEQEEIKDRKLYKLDKTFEELKWE